MKRIVLMMTILGLCMAANAKEWKIGTEFLKSVTFEMPDDYHCTYGSDTTRTDLRYVFTKEDGTEVLFYMIEIDNFDKSKAHEMPDTTLLPALKNFEVISSETMYEGNVDRVIMYKNEKGEVIREYVCLLSVGIGYVTAYSPNGDYKEADAIAQSVDTSLEWTKVIKYGIAVILGLISAFIFANGWEKRKRNGKKFITNTLISVVFSLISTIVCMFMFGSSFWLVFFAYIICTILFGYIIASGGMIIAF